ncbi:MAG TPA: 50S ribosomal protein L11 methyltransferase [Pyrinomonadaceae bacterium]|nr:50S ribosomal protein L11 methyltransferase [Pyrinomonadaceae bacterium]
MSKQHWYALDVTVERPATEAIEFAFNQLDALGTEIDHLRYKNSATVVVTGYFHEIVDEQLSQCELNHALSAYGLTADVVHAQAWRRIEEIDWLAEWKKYWRPTVVGEFVIAPPWEKVEDPEKIVIRIEPNMAFGTGTHATTQLCLRAIQDNFTAGETFMDVGTGTGILAIAVAKLNAKVEDAWLPNRPSIFAVDTDEKAVEIAIENAAMNGVSDHIEFAARSISRDAPLFDFVCANLTADTILPLMPLLLEKARRILLLSGILKEQESSVVSQLEKLGVNHLQIAGSDEWISILAELDAD